MNAAEDLNCYRELENKLPKLAFVGYFNYIFNNKYVEDTTEYDYVDRRYVFTIVKYTKFGKKIKYVSTIFHFSHRIY